MKRASLILILAALSCSEPTAISQQREISVAPQQRHHGYSYSINSVDGSVYVEFSSLRSEGGVGLQDFMRGMFASADSAGAVRLVIDLRSLTGSDARLLVPLIKGVATRDRFARAGGLYVMVGPHSYSPAQNAATLLQQYAKPVFVQESSGR